MRHRMTRRRFLDAAALGAATFAIRSAAAAPKRPNLLFCITDDQSWLHTGAYGDPVVSTPAFDRIAREGVRFDHAYCAAPSCTASRGGICTGQHIWRLGEGANLWGTLPAKFPVYPDLLEAAGYHVGFTGKGWGPGNVTAGGRTRDPAGPAYRKIRCKPPKAIWPYDYAANFDAFLDARKPGQPFCFWYGAYEPHGPYDNGIGARSGLRAQDVQLPPFIPDTPGVRSYFLDYYFEIQYADQHLARMLAALEKAGELDNTIVIATGDNGVPIPRAKCNLYDYGTRMPFVVRWGARCKPGRVVDDLVSHCDVAPTFLEAAGVPVPKAMTGRSFLDVLLSTRQRRVDPARTEVLTGREGHVYHYPMRAIRTHDHLYIRNYEPDRAAAQPGAQPPEPWPLDRWDEAAARLNPYQLLVKMREHPRVAPLFDQAFGKRPAEELYDVRQDPCQLTDLAADPAHAKTRDALAARLTARLKATGDPRETGGPVLFESYKSYRPARKPKRKTK